MNACWKNTEKKYKHQIVYYLSDLEYSTIEDIVKCLKKAEYKDIVDLKFRMKLTDTEINIILFEE